MGIKDLFKIVAETKSTIDLRGKRIGIDTSCEIYRISLGAHSGLLSGFANQIYQYKKLGVKGMVYIFDNPEPNSMKSTEHKKRKARREKYAEKAEIESCPDQKNRYEKQCFSITPEMVHDIQELLNYMGVAWITARKGYEAEHIGAYLTKIRLIDTFVTSDSDTLTFGCVSMLRHGQEYSTSRVLKYLRLSYDDFVKMCVVLGCDFAEKTKGIGPKTVLQKLHSVTLTDQQRAAYEYFRAEYPFDPSELNRSPFDKDVAIDWLVERKIFSRAYATALMQHDAQP